MASSNKPIRVAVVGATGYTGGELLRLLAGHPRATVTAVTSEQSAGKSVADVFPSLARIINLPLAAFNPEKVGADVDLAFDDGCVGDDLAVELQDEVPAAEGVLPVLLAEPFLLVVPEGRHQDRANGGDIGRAMAKQLLGG